MIQHLSTYNSVIRKIRKLKEEGLFVLLRKTLIKRRRNGNTSFCPNNVLLLKFRTTTFKYNSDKNGNNHNLKEASWNGRECITLFFPRANHAVQARMFWTRHDLQVHCIQSRRKYTCVNGRCNYDIFSRDDSTFASHNGAGTSLREAHSLSLHY